MRVLIRYQDQLRKFAVIDVSPRDGSVILVLRREGASAHRARWTIGREPSVVEVRPTEGDSKSKRVTIHQSGRVNFHWGRPPIFIEPLFKTTKTSSVCAYRVPDLGKLDAHAGEPAAEDVVFDLSDLGDGPVTFLLQVGPTTINPAGRAVKLSYEQDGYALIVEVAQDAVPIPAGYEQHFITFAPEQGLFPAQQMPEDLALLHYHQLRNGALNQPMLYPPNGEDIFQLFFAVPMRIAPIFNIEFDDPDLHVTEAEVQRDDRSNKVTLKFKIRNRTSGAIIRDPVPIRSVTLDAEFRDL